MPPTPAGAGVQKVNRQRSEMNKKNTKLQRYLYLTSAVILLAGLSCALMIYQTARNQLNDERGYEIVGGFIYSSTGENTKKYVHDLQLYGGNASVLADEFMHWFAGLWHGESLAFTIAWIAILSSLGIFIIARKLPTRSESDGDREK
jgi:hypothetical protein